MIKFGKFIIIFIMSIYIVFYFFHKEILFGYASFFDVSKCTKNADAIIILSGNPKTRPAKAIDLYREGYGKSIYTTQPKEEIDNYANLFISQYKTVQNIGKIEDVDIQIIPSIKGGVTSTFDEAYDVVKYIKKHKISHIILITDIFHTRRALYAFRKIFENEKIDIKLEICGANNNIYNKKNWWLTELGISNYIIEPFKLIMYMLISKNYEYIKQQ